MSTKPPHKTKFDPIRQEDVNALATSMGFDAAQIERHSPGVGDCAILTQDIGQGKHVQVMLTQSDFGYPTALKVTTSLFGPDGKHCIAKKTSVNVDDIEHVAPVVADHIKEIHLQRAYPCDAYVHTYVRIHTDAYRHKDAPYHQSIGFRSDEDGRAFSADALACLQAIGFENVRDDLPRLKSNCITVARGRESLYCHPDELDGQLKEGTLDEVLKTIEHAKTFSLRSVDEYARSLAITPEQYREILTSRTEDIKERLIESLKTTRRDKMYRQSAVVVETADFVLPLMEPTYDRSTGKMVCDGDVTTKLIAARHTAITQAIDELVQSGHLHRAQYQDGAYVRTRGKAELAEFRREQRKAQKAEQEAAEQPGEDETVTMGPGM